ncbi:Nodule Cysteine-Rich (NCR) secreted peptide [Medicago truncatula]|uniref:Nodule Cysteine-Rich (NCR) secreted peptide n=1 Tax=Medicago truncatula TaxID=3880 RepID=G7L3W7_MEDTR|nr:Nodule Cysteine-Rich (NCR) secreted peptide [Medicago truncatula]
MAEIFKFFYALIIFISLILSVANAGKSLFSDISNFHIYHIIIIHNHSFLLVTFFYFYFNSDPMYCFNDDDCRELKCSHPRVRKCRMFLCRCEEVDKEDEK